jgi:uncharacterized protein (DUF697 family)
MEQPMPKLPGPMTAVSTVRNFIDVMKEFSFDEVRDSAERMPRIVVLAETIETAEAIGTALTGVSGSPAVLAQSLDSKELNLDRADVVVVHDPASGQSFACLRGQAPHAGTGVFDLPIFNPANPESIEQLRTRIATQLPELAPSLGRWFKPFRPAASKAVIDESSKVNAQFALVSNIPAAIPIVGSFAAAGADFIVLTKNQLMLIYKLAAIHDRDLHDRTRIVKEMIPVVGAGLAWRTVAREATSFIPLAAGTIPKVAIAYSGTMAAGWAAEFYYRYGKKPTREQWKGYLASAAEAVKDIRFPSVTNRAPATPPPAIDHA